jgi:hypothetical protein
MSEIGAQARSEQAQLMQRQVQWLVDREEIRNTKQLYCRFSDNGRYGEWEDLFTEDYTCELYGPPTADGSEAHVVKFSTKEAWVSFARKSGALRAQIDATAGRGDANPGHAANGASDVSAQRVPGTGGWAPGAAHHMHGGEIEFTGPDTARAIWPSQFNGNNGYYDEEYRKVQGIWKIARGKFFAQARREYAEGDYPYSLEVGDRPASPNRQIQINFK